MRPTTFRHIDKEIDSPLVEIERNPERSVRMYVTIKKALAHDILVMCQPFFNVEPCKIESDPL